ncbi:MAG TPA: hypothetical protein VHM64_04895 [Candidatus Binatia bacterium]|nr:hypothetical protein [Candidatus Binatia bacterium]
MPPVDPTKADPLSLLLDEIELLSAQTRSLELSLKRAHTDAFEQVEKFQQQFRTKLSNLKAEFEDRGSSNRSAVRSDESLPDTELDAERVRRAAAQQIEVIRRDAQAKIAALQSEIAHKTALLTQNQATIARLEERKALSQSSSKEPETSRQTEAAEITRRDAEIAELRSAAQRQEKAAAAALDHARESFSTQIEALRAELNQKQLLLEQQQSGPKAEQELRNGYRELQGRLAAKESVIESQEYHLRTAQSELLAATDALAERERALAEAAARAAEQDHQFELERNQWQCRIRETQQVINRFRDEVEQAKAELGKALERVSTLAQQESAAREQAEQLNLQVNELKRQLSEKQVALEKQGEIVRRTEAGEAELSAAVSELQEALAKQQASARHTEQSLASELAALRSELERKTGALREREGIASRPEPDFTAQIQDFQMRLQEKECLLEARAREITILEARVESLSGETARLEAAQKQALADAPAESGRPKEALEAEIVALRSASDHQRILLEERQAAREELEKTLRAELASAKEQSAEQQRLLEKQSIDLQQATENAHALRERMAQTVAAAREAEEIGSHRSESDTQRIAALEHDLESTKQMLAEREAALKQVERQLSEGNAGLHGTHDRAALEDQSTQLRAAQDKIADLLERLAQLEAARQSLQENAGHELQQLRESFETRIAKLRMELAAKEQAPAPEPPPANGQITTALSEGGLEKRIHELRSQLAEKHALLENRNEELIRVRAELDDLREGFAGLANSVAQEPMEKPSVELREEDVMDLPHPLNGSAAPDTLQARGDAMRGGDTASNRFTQLEGRVRAWNPQPEDDSAFGSGRRWHIGLFKRRWKA